MHIRILLIQLYYQLDMPTIYQIMLGLEDALHLSVAYGNFEGVDKMKEKSPSNNYAKNPSIHC